MWELICEKQEHIRDSLVCEIRELVRDSLVCEKWELVREKTFYPGQVIILNNLSGKR